MIPDETLLNNRRVADPPSPNRLFLFGSDRTLVCEEKAPKIVAEGDAVNPMIIECSHGGK